jgi:voltage-gated potassium channel
LKKQVRLLLGILLVSLVGCTTAFWYLETPSSLGDALWWWVVTSSTVGYGDVVPVTAPGRAAGVFAIIVGIYVYTYAAILIIERVQEMMESSERGREQLTSTDHVLICEYTAYSDELIQQDMAEGVFENREIAILTALVDRRPYPQHRFVYGVPINPQALQRANVSRAAYIFVFSNERFREPDKKTLHVVSRIMRLNRRAPLFVELNNPEHPMLERLPRPVIAMKTEDLLQAALGHRYIDASRYLNQV